MIFYLAFTSIVMSVFFLIGLTNSLECFTPLTAIAGYIVGFMVFYLAVKALDLTKEVKKVHSDFNRYVYASNGEPTPFSRIAKINQYATKK